MPEINDERPVCGLKITDQAVRSNLPHRWADIDELQRMAASEKLLHVVCRMLPPLPGSTLFQVILEHENYPVGTPRNLNLQIALVDWQSLGWSIVSIPIEDRPAAERAAASARLRLRSGPLNVRREGKLIFVGAGGSPMHGTQIFPVHGPRVLTLAPIKSLRPFTMREEFDRINRILAGHGLPGVGSGRRL